MSRKKMAVRKPLKKYSIALDEHLVKRLDAMAKREDRSRSNMVTVILRRALYE